MRTSIARKLFALTVLTVVSPAAGVAAVSPTVGVAAVSPTVGVAAVSPTAGVAVVSPTVGVAAVSPAAGVAAVSPTVGVAVVSPTGGVAAVSPTVGIVAVSPTVEVKDTALLPQAPGRPEGTFLVLTQSGAAPQPTVRLSWAPAEPGDYLIGGYRIYRSTGAGWETRPEDGTLVKGLSLDDPAHVGWRYDYAVAAVDSRGKPGLRSPLGSVDLAALPAESLAPRAPLGVSATSRRYDVLLRWDAAPTWVAPVSGYRVYRGDSPDVLASSIPLTLSGTNLTQTPPGQGKPRWYAVATVDIDGRVSPMSETVSAMATGTVAPSEPKDLTTKARTEKVSLAWSAAVAGTAPISGYLLRRRQEGQDHWKALATLAPGRRDYSDSVPGDRGYLYSLAAFDSEGNTGAAAYVGASPAAKVLNKTLIVTMPTAYANFKDGDRGLNLNVLFDFYVGSLFESYQNPITGQTKSGQLQPLQIATVSTDTKWALLDDRGLIPGLAAGLYISALINFGQPTGAQTVGISSSGGAIATLGNAYVVMSKRFWPGRPKAAIHAGYFLGGLSDSIAQSGLPKDWVLTARHLLPGGDIPTLFSHFVDPKLGATIGQAPDMVFGGLTVPFTVPLIFTEWNTGIRIEYMTPLPNRAEYAATNQPLPNLDPATQLPWLLNVHIDNLPLFGFEFGYFQFPGGYQLIAFYHIPDLNWAW